MDSRKYVNSIKDTKKRFNFLKKFFNDNDSSQSYNKDCVYKFFVCYEFGIVFHKLKLIFIFGLENFPVKAKSFLFLK